MRPTNSPLRRRCGTQEETAANVLYKCELFLGPDDVRSLKSVDVKEQGSHDLASD